MAASLAGMNRISKNFLRLKPIQLSRGALNRIRRRLQLPLGPARRTQSFDALRLAFDRCSSRRASRSISRLTMASSRFRNRAPKM